MKLSQLLNEVNVSFQHLKNDFTIQNLEIDSRNVKPSNLFVCLKEKDEKLCLRFIEEAQDKGAQAVVCQENLKIKADDIPIIRVSSPREFLKRAIRVFFREILDELSITGITGTNGKTSIAYLLANALNGIYVGTLGIGKSNHLVKTNHTTPEALFILQSIKDHSLSATELCIECSSHALAQGRLLGLPIETAIWTNLTHDHLDYHQTMEVYFEAKSLLFLQSDLKTAIINQDCAYGRKLIKKLRHSGVKTLSYSLHDFASDAYFNRLSFETTKMKLSGVINNRFYEFDTVLLGDFNALNLLAVCLTLGEKGVYGETLNKIVSHLKPVPGRLEIIHSSPFIYLDYAHTPDALRHALKALRLNLKGRLWCVFGCGGDRDKEKREIMGSIAEEIADRVILTSDNPRSEEPDLIIKDILKGINEPSSVKSFVDRREALSCVFHNSSQQDRVLIAGKGHESTQEFADVIVPFSDREEILALSKLKESRKEK